MGGCELMQLTYKPSGLRARSDGEPLRLTVRLSPSIRERLRQQFLYGFTNEAIMTSPLSFRT
jgi:hypothetical protein